VSTAAILAFQRLNNGLLLDEWVGEVLQLQNVSKQKLNPIKLSYKQHEILEGQFKIEHI
jgi:hypothetical protein